MGDQQTVSGHPVQTKWCLEQAFGYRKKTKGILSEIDDIGSCMEDCEKPLKDAIKILENLIGGNNETHTVS